jgi:hypothetical protein
MILARQLPEIVLTAEGPSVNRAEPVEKQKKPRLMLRRGYKNCVALLIFPGLMMPGLELAPVIET